MLIPGSTNARLQIVPTVVGDLRVSMSVYVTDTAVPPVMQGSENAQTVLASITAAATTDILAGTLSRTKRIGDMQIFNNSTTVTSPFTLQRTDGTNTNPITSVSLAPKESLFYENGRFWRATSALEVYGAVAAQQFPSLMMCPGLMNASLTGVKTLTSATSFAVYVGKAGKSTTSVSVLYRITTAPVTPTWAEIAVAKGSINPRGNPTLSIVGFTDILTPIATTGQKTTIVNVSAGQQILPGDDLWLIIGHAATTAGVARAASIADDLQVGYQASVAQRPSLIVGTPTVWTLDSATTLQVQMAAVVS